jgi:hypothetical protein
VKFGVKNANSRRASLLIGVKYVAANRHADLIELCLARTHSADGVGIVRDFASSGVWCGKIKKMVPLPMI